MESHTKEVKVLNYIDMLTPIMLDARVLDGPQKGIYSW